LRYQVKTIEDNLLKVIFRSKPLDSFMLNLDGQYRSHSQPQLQQLITKLVPGMVIFDKLIETVAYLCNQIRCIDNNVVLLGRRGTGKRFLVQLVSKLTGATFVTHFSEAVLAAIKQQKTFYIEQVEDAHTIYEEFLDCQQDKDIEKFIDSDKREAYYSSIAGGEDYTEGRLVGRCRDNIQFLFLCDERESHASFCHRRREVLNMPVCLVEEWPTEALLNLYTINDPNPNIHAQLFTRVNTVLAQLKSSTIPLKTFEKYLKVFY
jgi:hypothetical protein